AQFARALPDEPPDESTGDLFLPHDLKSLILAECIELLYPRYVSCGKALNLLGWWTPAHPTAEANRFCAALNRLIAATGPRGGRGGGPVTQDDFVGRFFSFFEEPDFPISRVVALEAFGLYAPSSTTLQEFRRALRPDPDPHRPSGILAPTT